MPLALQESGVGTAGAGRSLRSLQEVNHRRILPDQGRRARHFGPSGLRLAVGSPESQTRGAKNVSRAGQDATMKEYTD